MTRAAWFWLLAAACAAPAGGDDLAPVTAPTAPAEAPPTTACGDEPLPACPLNWFMESTLAPTFKRRDFPTLREHFGTLASYAPAEYPQWAEWALRGADAAAKGSTDEVRAVCGGCHRQYRDDYRRNLRARALLVREGAR